MPISTEGVDAVWSAGNTKDICKLAAMFFLNLLVFVRRKFIHDIVDAGLRGWQFSPGTTGNLVLDGLRQDAAEHFSKVVVGDAHTMFETCFLPFAHEDHKFVHRRALGTEGKLRIPPSAVWWDPPSMSMNIRRQISKPL